MPERHRGSNLFQVNLPPPRHSAQALELGNGTTIADQLNAVMIAYGLGGAGLSERFAPKAHLMQGKVVEFAGLSFISVSEVHAALAPPAGGDLVR